MMPTPQSRGLSGKSFLVTRPEGQADVLLRGIRALGARADHIPFLAIEPIPNLAPLASIAHMLPDYAACIFISANAARIAWPMLSQGGWPGDRVAACVGPGTAAVLRELGVQRIIMPESCFDSEGLLAEGIFVKAHCEGRAFALIRGEGGRDYLAQALRARGAHVDEASVYRRQLHPDAVERLQTWLHLQTDPANVMLIVSSSDSLQRVISAADQALASRLKQLPVLVPHGRIAEIACQLGFNHVETTAGGDNGLLDYLRSYNGSSTTTLTDETGAS